MGEKRIGLGRALRTVEPRRKLQSMGAFEDNFSGRLAMS